MHPRTYSALGAALSASLLAAAGAAQAASLITNGDFETGGGSLRRYLQLDEWQLALPLGLAFAALFLAPDLSFAGYLAGPRVGAAAYDTMHSTVAPLRLAAHT